MDRPRTPRTLPDRDHPVRNIDQASPGKTIPPGKEEEYPEEDGATGWPPDIE